MVQVDRLARCRQQGSDQENTTHSQHPNVQATLAHCSFGPNCDLPSGRQLFGAASNPSRCGAVWRYSRPTPRKSCTIGRSMG